MNTWVRRSLNAGVLTAGALLVSGAAAQASPVMTSTDNLGLLNGTQALIPVQAPINACGVAVGVLGAAHADCVGGAAAVSPEWGWGAYESGANLVTGGNDGILNGTQALVPVQVPVNVCGVAVGVAAPAGASCDGGAVAGNLPDPISPYEAAVASSGAAETSLVSSGNLGALNGTQVVAPVQVPVNVCGVAVGALLGGAGASCDGGAAALR